MIKAFSSLLSLGMLVAGCTGSRPMDLGVHDGKLAPCPASPNCVSSQSSDKDHAVEAIPFSGTPAEAMAKLKVVLSAMPRVTIVTATETYLHAEFTSALFRFVDDVEFCLDESTRTVHLRSASRVGSSDLGVNRKRIENLRTAMRGLHTK
ncbi:MAG: DUF1499 domain-containing protein [Nitrospirota bacterium]